MTTVSTLVNSETGDVLTYGEAKPGSPLAALRAYTAAHASEAVTAVTAVTMFSGAELIERTAAGYEERIALARHALATFGPGVVSPRCARDEIGDTERRIAGARAFLAGEHDRTYAGTMPGFPWSDVQGWREHYADDSVRAAVHHLVWAEHYAGLRTRESAVALDPWRTA